MSASRHMIVEFPRPDGGRDVMTPGNPVKLSKMAEGPETAPPCLGEHTDDVLRQELGLSAEAIAELRASGAVG